ncbi:type II secretion system minor pseudopilin GspJ [Pseudomonas sp. LS44]|uniref:type II secretion system minor pseudopilin GspJ n=1 Tax=Pseudomonas sp. LS44 TaxID=1357074 RepID=UPI00215B27A7|nr:type II secretion system minor pseudopilin GspJ [Pseudomonas sp. LS44]UVE19082.1 type II secretion system minor pseudopilin GspJ [Pseudomonas sp. LS44]
MKRSAGFTLLELLVAIAIFAVLALATYRMLDSVLRTDAATREQERQLRELTRGIAAFERDVLQVLARPVRDAYGEPRSALEGEGGDKPAIELTRSGWRNPTGAVRSRLQRVRWQLSGEQWQRRYWLVLDQAQDSQPQVQQVLDGVMHFSLRYLDDEGQWIDSWPADRGASEESLQLLPRAVEMTLEHRRYGTLRRVLRLPDTAEPEEQAATGEEPGEPEAPTESDVPAEPSP